MEQQIVNNQINDDERKIEQYAKSIMELARDTITVRFRFFDTALGRLKLVPKPKSGGFVCDGKNIFYDPYALLRIYMDEPGVAVRLYLHMLMHQVFLHAYRADKTNTDYWDIACDIAVENIILEMDISAANLTRDDEQRGRLARIKKWCPVLSADKLYREFMINGISKSSYADYIRLFRIDTHLKWTGRSENNEIMITEEEWKKLSERIKTDLKTFSKNRNGSESLDTNLEEATKKRYDYQDVLRQFAVSGEEIQVSPDEFDYIYYTYGLSVYGKMPLIEPLEYTETKKVKEFIIALDTSASCRGKVVKAFLQKSYDILKTSDSFFKKTNIHIIQCDAGIRQDTKITCDSDFNDFIENGKLTGFGATDFRPVFLYVQELMEQGEFEDIKGLIYFTDGYGIYPEKMPPYKVIFAFLDEDPNRAKPPVWAMQLILESESLEAD